MLNAHQRFLINVRNKNRSFKKYYTKTFLLILVFHILYYKKKLLTLFYSNSTDEDARQAFQLDNGKIKEIQIKLLLSSRTEMQKVIEAARNKQTPFATAGSQPVIPAAQDKKDDNRDKSKDDSRRDSKDRRRRSRSRTRSRERERRDRSRDRRDRRRRDRSRSRDRRDRRRDRRSKSRERTRSRERDARRSRDKRRDSREERNDVVNNGNNKDMNEQSKPSLWERNQHPQIPPQNVTANTPSLLGNYPGPNVSPLEDARRSLGIVTGLHSILTGQSSLLNLPNQLNNGLPREDIMKRDNWQGNKRFQDRNPVQDKIVIDGFPQNQNRGLNVEPPNVPKMNFVYNPRPPMFHNNMGMRMPFNPEMGNMNRPFMNRPGPITPNENMPQNRNDFHFNKNEIKEDSERFPRERRMDGKMESCVQLRPYFGGYAEIRRFFNGLHISNTGIKFTTDCNGRRTGLCYIRFVRPQHRPLALRHNGGMLRGVNVEVAPITDEEFDNYGVQKRDDENDDDDVIIEREDSAGKQLPFTCIVVEDLPSFAKEHDILKMFSDYSLLGINIESQNRRRMAYVQFTKEEDAAKALEDKNKHFLGAKPISVCPSYENKFADIIGPPKEQPQEIEIEKPECIEIKDDDNEEPEQYNENAASFDTDVVLLTGLPFKTTDRDVIDFFSDIGLVPIKIHMSINKFGPTGECYCEFGSPSEAVAALDKNGMPLGSGVVNVEPFPRRDMERNLNSGRPHPLQHPPHLPNQRFLGRLGPRPGLIGMSPRMGMRPPNPMNRYDGPLDNIGPPGCVLAMENVPFKAGVEEILDFFENFNVGTQNVLRRYNDNGNATGDARVTFGSPAEAHRAFEECRYKKIRDRTIFLRIL